MLKREWKNFNSNLANYLKMRKKGKTSKMRSIIFKKDSLLEMLFVISRVLAWLNFRNTYLLTKGVG